MTQAVAAVHAGADAGGAVVGMVRSLRGSLGCLHGGSVRTVLLSLAAQLERGAGRMLAEFRGMREYLQEGRDLL